MAKGADQVSRKECHSSYLIPRCLLNIYTFSSYTDVRCNWNIITHFLQFIKKTGSHVFNEENTAQFFYNKKMNNDKESSESVPNLTVYSGLHLQFLSPAT